ncbi:MAG: hypothetical protein HC908_18685 [Calothrix sp. SM1_7_51]|nr:hypothetical protein [Calothrix sp. SM1_7_51]
MFNANSEQVLQIPLSERWLVYHRLQELDITCSRSESGLLRVQVNNSTAAILIRSTLIQIFANRCELVDWLERCWNYNTDD